METAIKVSDHILDGIERLGDFPDSGSRTPDDWLKEQGYRMAISGKYVSIYRVIKDIVYIYHIADTELNIRSYSNKEGLPVGMLEGFLYA